MLLFSDKIVKLMRKKKNFILLELLIAFALVGISILPFMRFPYSSMKEEIDLLFKMELEKKGQEQLVNTQVALLANEIEAKYLFENNKEFHLSQPEQITITLPGKIERKFQMVRILKPKHTKIDKESMRWSLVELKVLFYQHPKKKDENSFLTLETEVCCSKKI